MIIESVNFLAILTSYAVIDVVMNFLALCIISDFDDFFYATLRDEPNKDLITDPNFSSLVMIERTSSRRAIEQRPEHLMTKEALNIPESELQNIT